MHGCGQLVVNLSILSTVVHAFVVQASTPFFLVTHNTIISQNLHLVHRYN